MILVENILYWNGCIDIDCIEIVVKFCLTTHVFLYTDILDLEDTDGLYDGTICMDTKISDTEHYNAHNLYGHTMAAAAAE